MKHVRMAVLILAAMGALAGLWTWGERQSQELDEWRRVWGDVYATVTGGEALPGGVSVETLGRNVLKEWETTRRGGAEVRGSVEELETALRASNARAAAAEKSLAELRAHMEAEEAAAVAELRERYLAGIENAQEEVAQAREERAKAVKELAAVQTRLAELQADLDALMNAPGDALDLAGEPEDEEDGTSAGQPLLEVPALPGTAASAPAEKPLAATLAEVAPDLSPDEIASLAALDERDGDSGGEPAADADGDTGEVHADAVVPSRVIGESRLFLTLTYREADLTLRVQFRNGSELLYSGVPRAVADSLRDAGNKLDQRMRDRVKGKFATAPSEDPVWKSCSKWNRGRKERMEALWVEETAAEE